MPEGSRLLASLPEDVRDAIEADAEIIAFGSGDVVVPSGPPPPFVSFVNSGLVSYIVTVPDGGRVEIGIGGAESLLPAEAGLGMGGPVYGTTIFQQPGTVTRIPLARFTALAAASPALAALARRAATAWTEIIAQNAACNAQHVVEQRLSRWLLLALDRVGGERLELTHEFLSLILAVRRATVTVVADRVREKGAIDYRYGALHVRSREMLEELACPCYTVMRETTEAIFATAAR